MLKQSRTVSALFGAPLYTFIYLRVRRDKLKKALLIEICPCIHSNAYDMSGANWQIYPEDTYLSQATTLLSISMHKANSFEQEGSTSSWPKTTHPEPHKKGKNCHQHTELCYSPNSHWEKPSRIFKSLEQDALTGNPSASSFRSQQQELFKESHGGREDLSHL